MIGLLKYLAGCLLCWIVYGFVELIARVCAQLKEGWADDAGESDPEEGSQGADAETDGDPVRMLFAADQRD